MNLCEALKESKKTHGCVRRPHWDKRHVYVEYMYNLGMPTPREGGMKRTYASVVCEYRDNVHHPGWTPSQEDILTEDWLVCTYEELQAY